MKDINLDLSLFEQVVLDEDGRAHGFGWAGQTVGRRQGNAHLENICGRETLEQRSMLIQLLYFCATDLVTSSANGGPEFLFNGCLVSFAACCPCPGLQVFLAVLAARLDIRTICHEGYNGVCHMPAPILRSGFNSKSSSLLYCQRSKKRGPLASSPYKRFSFRSGNCKFLSSQTSRIAGNTLGAI